MARRGFLIIMFPWYQLMRVGVHGCPQSATGQATIVTGLNVPRLTGKHWGPKPDVEIQRIVRSDNLLLPLANSDHSLKLTNAYPPKFFDAINSGMRSYSALQPAFVTAGIALYTDDDLRDGRAYSADFTTGVFHTVPKVSVAPLYSLRECGRMLARKAQQHSLVLFDHWLSDLIGHPGTMDEAARLLERFDEVMGGIMDEWDMDDALALVTSDHGNIEDMSSRHHTLNLVPTLLIGISHARLSDEINDLSICLSTLKALGSFYKKTVEIACYTYLAEYLLSFRKNLPLAVTPG